jgi:hypothetical protein
MVAAFTSGCKKLLLLPEEFSSQNKALWPRHILAVPHDMAVL